MVAPTRYCGAVHRKFSVQTRTSGLPSVRETIPATSAVLARKYVIEAEKNRRGTLVPSHEACETAYAAEVATATFAPLNIRRIGCARSFALQTDWHMVDVTAMRRAASRFSWQMPARMKM